MSRVEQSDSDSSDIIVVSDDDDFPTPARKRPKKEKEVIIILSDESDDTRGTNSDENWGKVLHSTSGKRRDNFIYYDDVIQLPCKLTSNANCLQSHVALNMILSAKPENLATIVPSGVSKNVLFLINLNNIGTWKNVLSDGLGSWKNNGLQSTILQSKP